MKKKTIITLVAVAVAAMMVLGIGATAFAAPETAAAEAATATADDTAKRERGSGGKGNGKGARVSVISVAAQVLGMSEEDVLAAVKAGKVGDLLVAQDKVDAFKTAYLSEAKTKLDAKVADGSMTQAEADEAYAKAEEKMASYDGTTHLCGGTDHSNMFQKAGKAADAETDAAA